MKRICVTLKLGYLCNSQSFIVFSWKSKFEVFKNKKNFRKNLNSEDVECRNC